MITWDLKNRTDYGEYNTCPALTSHYIKWYSTLHHIPSGSLQWYENNVLIPGATSSTIDINPLEYGVYAVTITVNGCTVRSDDFVYLITETEMSIGKELTVYPNPVREELSFTFLHPAVAVDFKVNDMMGRTIKNIQGTGTEHTNLHARI